MCPGVTTDVDNNLPNHGTLRKTYLIDRELARLKIDVAALQETRLLESGKIREENFTFFWQGRGADENRIHGVGFAVSNKIVKDFDTPVGISERIITMTYKKTGSPTHLVCAYAPTMTSEADVIDCFYDSLANVLAKFPPGNGTILLGDFNARVGADHTSWPDVIGHYGVGKTNENGQRMLELCSQHGLCIANTWFKQAEIRRVTWRHPRSKHWHQLDLVLVKRTAIGSVRCSRTYHSADGDTDHSLVVTKLTLSKSKTVPKRSKEKPRLNTSNMRQEENIRVFRNLLSKKLPPNSQNTDPVENWKNIRDALYCAAIDSFGVKRPPQEDWMAVNADKLEPLIAAKHKAHKAYKKRATRHSLTALKTAQRELQKEARFCANDYWNKLCDSIQLASDTGNLREMYSCLNKAIGPKSKKMCPLKSADGALITDSDQQMERWVEHYAELYGQPRSISAKALDATPTMDTMSELDNMPTLQELQHALNHTSKGKAPGPDGIPADLLKCDSIIIPHLYELLCQCWEEEAFPEDMKKAKITTLYKQKGDKGDCNNYRGISLLSVTGKVFAKVLLVRLQKLANQVYPESQCGFRSGRSTLDMIFTVRQLQEKCREQRKSLHIAFVDLTKAFDTVSREGLFAILQKIGCPPKLLKLIKSLHDDMTATVSFEGATSDDFAVRCGVKQGCVLAPTLFGIFFSVVWRYAFRDQEPVQSGGIYLHTRSDGKLFNPTRLRAKRRTRKILIRELLFADDAALVSHSPSGLQSLLDQLSEACSEFGLIISTKKTVVMHQADTPDIPITINGNELKTVDDFTYLGAVISSNCMLDKEIPSRIGKAATTFSRLRSRAWQNKYLTEHTKARIYECCVLSVLLYGSETWTTYVRQEQKLNAFHLRCLRHILGVTWRDKVTNQEVLARTHSHSIFNILKSRRLRWLGHLYRMQDGRLPKDVLYGELASGTRRRGRPLLRFKDACKRDLGKFDIDQADWESLAGDRVGWRRLLREGGAVFDRGWLQALAQRRASNRDLSC